MCFEGDGDTNDFKCSCTLEFVTRLTRYGWCLPQDRGKWRFIMYPSLSSLCYHSGKVTWDREHFCWLFARREQSENDRFFITLRRELVAKLVVWVGLFQGKGLLNRLIHVDYTFDMNHGCLLPATCYLTVRQNGVVDRCISSHFCKTARTDTHTHMYNNNSNNNNNNNNTRMYTYTYTFFCTYSHIFTHSLHNCLHIHAYICCLYIHTCVHL